MVEVLTILAIVVGPILAVQVDKYLGRKREERNRRTWVFKTLMLTRGTVLSPQHVEALNSIDIEFSSGHEKDKKVRNAWKTYLDELAHYPNNGQDDEKKRWAERTNELLVELLSVMSDAVGYEFDKTHIKRAAYVPVRFADVEFEQDFIRRSLVGILLGQKKFPVEMHMAHSESGGQSLQEKLQQLLIQHYEGGRPIKVVIENGEGQLLPLAVKKQA